MNILNQLLETLPRDIKYHILVHSHYDPAWFARRKVTKKLLLPYFEKIFDLLDRYPEYKFIFDCQTQVVEDYLDSLGGKERKKKERKLRGYISRGRFVVGPYYAGVDWNLSGAALLRKNFLYGIKDARALGWEGKFSGWLVDQFGFPAQTWQIHKGFDIDSVFLWRGLGVKPEEANTELALISPDGTKMLGKWLFIQGYRFGLYLGKCKEIALPRLVLEGGKILSYSKSNDVLIMDGYEGELEPDNPVELIREVRKRGGNAAISTPQKYLEEVKKDVNLDELPRMEGYQNYGVYSPVLKGVASSRQYLKQAHQACDTLLLRWLEPSAYLLHSLGIRQDWEGVERLWRGLIRMASHDEFGGCGIDDIHRDSMRTYSKIFREAKKLLGKNLKTIARNVDTSKFGKDAIPLVVFNPSSWRRKTLAYVADIPKWRDFVVLDEKRSEIPYQLIKRGGENVGMVIFTHDDIPPLGYKTYYIQKAESRKKAEVKNPVMSGKDWMENLFVRVAINPDGTFILVNKATGKEYRDLGYFKIEPDKGDTYDYSHIKENVIFKTKHVLAKIICEERGPLFTRFRIEHSLDVPVGLDETRNRWKTRKKKLGIITSIGLSKDLPRVDLDIKIHNTTKDHRIRICFPTEFMTDYLDVARQYDIARVPIKEWWLSPEQREDISRKVEGMIFSGMDLSPSRTNFNFQFADLGDGEEGLAFINRSNFECEVSIDEKKRRIFELTLLRCVGWNAKGDLLTREGNVGWDIYTPDAQCLGKYSFALSLLPHRGNWQEGEIPRWAESRNLGLRVIQTQAFKGALPPSFSFLKVDSKEIIISEITKAQDSDDLIVILYNPGERSTKGELVLNADIKEAYKAKLNEEVMERLDVIDKRKIKISVSPKEIYALRLKLKFPFSAKENLPVSARMEDIPELESYIQIHMRPLVTWKEVEMERKRWVALREKYKDLEKRVKKKEGLKDLIDYYGVEEKQINLACKVKEANYSYLLTLKRFLERDGGEDEIDRVDRKINSMAKDLIGLRVERRVAEIYRLFYETVEKWKKE